MAETNEDKILGLVKATLGYKSSVRDELLKVIVKSVVDELEIQKRIKLDFENAEHLMFIVDYSCFRYENNEVYYSAPGTSSYEGTLTLAKVPDGFLVDILGEVLDVTDGVQTEIDGAKTSNFALLFQFEGDVNGTRHLFYNCSASRPSVASKTGKEIGTTELAFTASAKPAETVNDKAVVKTKTTANTTTAVYNAWFDAVYVKAPAVG